MRLRVAGVVHNDLLGRERLLNWLREIKDLEKTTPLFIAVEYDESIFGVIRSQRPVLRTLAAEAWPGSSQSVLKLIEDSLAYEGDLHELVFPAVDTLWLDQGRAVGDPTILSDYARDRLNIYKSFVAGESRALSNATLLTMSATAWERGSAPQPGGSDRDAKFARMILDRLKEERRGWAIVIVGSNHASGVQGGMVSRLKSQGIECQVNQLNP